MDFFNHAIEPNFATAESPVGMFSTSLIEHESEWRKLPQMAASRLPQKIAISRWQTTSEGMRDETAETESDTHVIKIVLRRTNMRLALAGKTIQDGYAMPGSLHVTEPETRARCVFRGPFDALHLHVPNALIAECAQELSWSSARGFFNQDAFFRAPWIERFGHTLLAAEELSGTLGQLYIDCLGTAFIAKLLSETYRATIPEGGKVGALAKWRLKRAFDYIEDNLEGSVTLADVSAAAGLTRMHFAAQFRASTGLRPHEYLLRRRVEKAQQLLASPDASVVDVALSVGFESQSHFTTVFKRFVGKPPHAWRQENEMQRA